MSQLRFTTPITITWPLAKVLIIELHPQDRGRVHVVYAVGEEVGGQFVERERLTKRITGAPAAIQTIVDDLDTRALNFLVAQGDLPTGTREA